jgi:tetratricopeptide (TPR) repeat protein
VADWAGTFEREAARYRDGEARLEDGSDERQRQLTRMGNAAWGAALCLLMQGDDAREWLTRAAERWRESYADAPAGSWGRPIGAIKALVLSDDWAGAAEASRWALEEGAGEAESAIGRYAAALACEVLGDWEHARVHADAIRIRDDFPRDVGDALATIAAEDVVGYVEAIESVLESFETRDEYLENVPVADTVLVLQALAGRRGMTAELSSELLP